MDIFSQKSLMTKPEEREKQEAFIVDTDPPEVPQAEPITPEAVDGVQTPADMLRDVKDTYVQVQLAPLEVGLSIAASAAGFMLGATNASVGAVKNLADYVVSGAGALALFPAKEAFPDLYDTVHDQFLHDTQAVWSDLMDDYNVVAENIVYEPHTDWAQRFVVNFSEKMESARQYLGDKAAGIPTVSQDEKFFTTESMEELAYTAALDDSLEGQLRMAAGAVGTASIDLALLAIGGLVSRSANKVKPQAPVATTHQAGQMNLTLEALDSLQNSKPRFASLQEAQNRIVELSSGKARQQITIETVEGLPTKVIGGQDAILALKEVKKKGMPIREVKVNFVEKDITNSLDPSAVAKANKGFRTDRDAEASLLSRAKKSIKDKLVRTAVDASGNVKRELLQSAGALGRKAVMDLELTAGATPRAVAVANDAWQRIYRNLSNKDGTGANVGGVTVSTERELFDQFTRAQRIIAIEKSKLGKAKKPKFEAGTTGHDMVNWLQALKQQVGPEKYAEMNIRSQALFDVAYTQLERILNEGLISKAEFDKMKGIDYLRTEFIDKIDPIVNQKVGGKIIQVGESGIQPIMGGSTRGVLLDSEALMNEMLIRSENRIARNRANKRLFDIASRDPKNAVVKMAKKDKKGELVEPKGDFELIRMRVNGKTEGVYMPTWLAQEWKISDPAISATVANVMRIVSGSAVVRPLATGYNPGFILTNMPRDIVHAWLATNSTYSAFLPQYLMQIGRDIAVVAKDSLTKSGRYEQYINEGGGLSFLTHQGRDVISRSAGDIAIRHKPKLALLRDTLSYINEQSEIMVRLAIRERVIRNQQASGGPIDTVEATWQARRYLDFAQGGTVVKALDNAVPYLNATTQAYKTVLRSAKEKPGEFTAKFMQLAGLYGAWEAYNMLFSADAHAQIPEKQRRQNFIIHTGDYIIDEQGNKRYEYYAVKKDTSTIAPTVWMEQLIDYYITGKPPTDSTFQYLTDSLPGMSNSIPILNAAHTYLSDYNFWYDKDIFGRDLNVEDYAKFKGLPAEPTDQAFKDFGEIFNLKPEALQQSVRQVVPSNTYMQIAGKAYEMMFADADPRELASTTEERMARMPFVNRIYKLTHPATVALDDMDRIAKPVNTEEFLRTQRLKDILFESSRSGDYGPARDYASTFANQDPFVYKDMMNRVVATQRLDIIFKKRKESFEDLPKSWWLGMLGLDSKARAEVYFEEWTGETANRKRFMDSTAAALSSGELDFMDSEFLYHLTKLKNQRNTESMSEED